MPMNAHARLVGFRWLCAPLALCVSLTGCGTIFLQGFPQEFNG